MTAMSPRRVMSVVEATALVERYRDEVLALLDAGIAAAVVGSAPCQGRAGELALDGRFYVQGNYLARIAEGSHAATFCRLRDLWVRQGYTVVDFRTFGGRDEATVDVHNPTDGVRVSLISTRPPTAVQVIIVTPCLWPPSPAGAT